MMTKKNTLVFVLFLINIQFVAAQTNSTNFDFPVKPGTEEWKKLETTKNMVEACQIPVGLLQELPTSHLLEICLNYPLLSNVFLFNDIEKGLNQYENDFNGFRELIKRKDVIPELVKKYKELDPSKIQQNSSSLEKGSYVLRMSYIELFLSQPLIIEKATADQKNKIIKEVNSKIEKKVQIPSWYGSIGLKTCNLALKKLTNDDKYNINKVGKSSSIRYTPKNSPVDVEDNITEASDLSRYQLDNLYQGLYPSAELINTYPGYDPSEMYSSSSKFNCHGYAWYMAQRGTLLSTQLFDPVIIMAMEDNSPYFLDGSYEETDQWVHPSIIRYMSADHSAITTEDPNIIVSKWGDGPLVRHATNVCPWAYSNVKYYVIYDFCDRYYQKMSYSISGPSQEYVNQATYSINLLQDYDEVEWQYSSNFTKTGETSNSITLNVNCNSSYNNGWVSATIIHAPNIYNCGDTIELPRKYVYTGKPLISFFDITFENTFGSPAYYLCNSHTGNYYEIDNKYEATNFDVQICDLNGQIIYQFSTSSTRRSINYTNLDGYYLFRIRGTNNCGTGNWCETEIEYRDCSTDELYFWPNPANNETLVEIDNNKVAPDNNKERSLTNNWSIEIYDQSGVKIREEELKGDEYKINTSGLKPGIYFVTARSKDKILKGKLLIER